MWFLLIAAAAYLLAWFLGMILFVLELIGPMSHWSRLFSNW